MSIFSRIADKIARSTSHNVLLNNLSYERTDNSFIIRKDDDSIELSSNDIKRVICTIDHSPISSAIPLDNDGFKSIITVGDSCTISFNVNNILDIDKSSLSNFFKNILKK